MAGPAGGDEDVAAEAAALDLDLIRDDLAEVRARHALGLDATDRRMLTTLIRSYNGGPAGLETLAAAMGEEAVTLEDVCEPYLMQLGFLMRTPRGRVATAPAYEHLGLTPPTPPPESGQQTLFHE